MTDRDRLIELIRQAKKSTKGVNCDLEREMLFVDHLLANGVIVPIRCKDCMFYKHTEIGDCMACVKQAAYKKPNDFCSCARLKEREGK